MRRLGSLFVVGIAVVFVSVGVRGQSRSTSNVVEASITDLQLALESGRVTSRELVELYMDGIVRYEDRINAVARSR